MATRSGSWSDHALEALRSAGYRRGGARQAVIDLLEAQSCALSALEIEEQLKAEGQAIGRASIYRALEQLEELGLVHRFEVNKGIASFEPADPTGHHHHHIVCDECGKVVPFEDSKLEQAIHDVERQSGFKISVHEVTLRGHCENC
jgi:Fur family ferric uptake transcriptional regulator